jgi:hypothetical protein
LVQEVAHEFQLPRTRSNVEKSHGGGYLAADAVAAALRRTGQAPRGFDRVRKVYAQARSDEVALMQEVHRRLHPDPERLREACLLACGMVPGRVELPGWVELLGRVE